MLQSQKRFYQVRGETPRHYMLAINLTKTTAAQNEVVLRYYTVRG